MQQQALAAWLQQQLGAELDSLQAVGGGCIHNAWQLQLKDGRRLFAKTNRAALLPVLAAEADGLAALAGACQVVSQHNGPAAAPSLPRVLAQGLAGDQAVLVLSWLELGSNGNGPAGEAWRALGAGLARLHRASLVDHNGGFGWHRDNFIGSAPQANGWLGSWERFFRERRLGAQLQRAERSGHSLPGANTLLERLPRWLADHETAPCLVHGDLWSGNAGLLTGGGGALFDPAVYRGDREVDLAMARLFGGFPRAFFAGYEQEWPLPPGHQNRVELYNLYHLLNHANLFGGGYWRQVERGIQNLLRSIDP